MNKRQSLCSTITFLVLIFGFSIATLFAPKRDFSERENRMLAKTPVPTLDSVLDGSFEEDYEKSLTDQFVLRDFWISLKTNVARLAGAKDIHDVYFADDNYLIEKHTGTFQTPIAKNNIRTLASFVENLSAMVGERNISVIIVPNAVDLLKSKLPPYADPYNEELYLKQIQSALPESVWFDASSVLRQHTDEQIFYRTDHHWTTKAAFWVYQEWAAWKKMTALQEKDCRIQLLSDRFEGTIAAKTGVSGIYDKLEYYQPNSLVQYSLSYNKGEDVRMDIIDREKLDTRDKYAAFFGGNFGLVEAVSGTDSQIILQQQTKNSSDILAGLRADAIIEKRSRNGEMKPADEKRRLLLIKDSYAHCFAPFLMAAFDEVDMVDLRYFNQSLSDYITEKGITDVMVLCNAAGFAEDLSMARLLT